MAARIPVQSEALLEQIEQPRDNHWVVFKGPTRQLGPVGLGGQGIIVRISFDRAEKRSHPSAIHIPAVHHHLDLEAQAYERMGDHPRIVKYLGRLEDGGLLLEFATGGGLDSFLKIFPQATQSLRRLWCLQLAGGVAHAHSHNILITNIHAGNAVVDLASLGVKLVDFGGAVIDGSPVCVWEEETHHLPRPDYTASGKSDIFALGHTLLTILLGHHPRDSTNGSGSYAPEDEPRILAYDKETQEQYRMGIFPNVSAIQPSALGEVLRGCWEQRYEGADEVLDALNSALEGEEVFKQGDDRRAALGVRVELTNWDEFVTNVSDDEIYSGVISTQVELESDM